MVKGEMKTSLILPRLERGYEEYYTRRELLDYLNLPDNLFSSIKIWYMSQLKYYAWEDGGYLHHSLERTKNGLYRWWMVPNDCGFP